MIWIPESELERIKKFEEDFNLMMLGLKEIPPPTPLSEQFVYVNCAYPYGICMERRSDKQIFELLDYGIPDLEKPVNRSYFERYSTGFDL